jgi:hypothetical protein
MLDSDLLPALKGEGSPSRAGRPPIDSGLHLPSEGQSGGQSPPLNQRNTMAL